MARAPAKNPLIKKNEVNILQEDSNEEVISTGTAKISNKKI